jgi:hypothetical protein
VAPLVRGCIGAALLGLIPCSLAAQVAVAGSVVAGHVEHRVDAGYGIASSSGTVAGVSARVTGWRLVELEGHAMGGRLRADTVGVGQRRLGEVAGHARVVPFEWLALGATAALRGYDGAIATQRWTLLGADAELRSRWGGRGVRSVVGATLLPHVRVSGQQHPDFGYGMRTGLEVERGRVIAGLDYRMERYVFPAATAGATRREQVAGLLLRVGGRW